MVNAVCCLRIGIGLLIAVSVAACTGGSSQDSGAGSAAQYTIGGTVSGLGGSGLSLQSNSGETLAIAADGPFTFHTTLTSGSSYYVIAASQPGNPSQTCTVGHSVGTIGGGNVSDVSVVCTNKTDMTADTIGITLVGIRGSGLVLQNNGADNLSATTNGTLSFAAGIPNGTPYEVSVLSPPIDPYEDCVVINGSGTTSGSDVANIVVSCTVNSNPKHTISGTITGVSGSIVLQDNGRDDLTVTADGPFVFPLKIPQGSVYDVTTRSASGGQSQTCQFQNARGVVGNHDVTDIVLACNANISVKAVVSGLSGTGLVLQNNGRDNLPVSANGTSSFPTGLTPGDTYAVTVFTQPTNPSQTCVVTNGTGTATSGASASVTCTTNQFLVGGTVTGLPDPGVAQGLGPGINLVLQNNLGDDFTIPVNSQGNVNFRFPTAIASGATYSVTVKTQPGIDTQFGPPGAIQTTTTCLVSGGTGSVGAGDVTGVVVNCVRAAGFAYVTNGTDNTVMPYVVDSATGLLIPSGPAVSTGASPSGVGASDLSFSLYVSNAGSGTLSVYNVDPNTGALTESAGSPLSMGLTSPTSMIYGLFANDFTLYVTDSLGTAPGSAAAFHVGATPTAPTLINQVQTGTGPASGSSYENSSQPFNSYFAVPNAASDTVSLFRVDAATAALTAVPGGAVPTGKTPRSVAHYASASPAGIPFETVYVANSGDGTISTYAVDLPSGALTQQGTALNVGAGINSLVATSVGLYATASQGVFGFAYAGNGSLVPAQNGIPYAAGAGPGPAAGLLNAVYVVNQADETISVFTVGTGGGTLTAVPSSVPIKTGHGPNSIVVIQRPQLGGG